VRRGNCKRNREEMREQSFPLRDDADVERNRLEGWRGDKATGGRAVGKKSDHAIF